MNYIKMGLELDSEGQYDKAIEAFYKAIKLCPEDLNSWIHFAKAFRFIQFDRINIPLKQALNHCLLQPISNHQDLAFAAISLIKLLPSFDYLLKLSEKNKIEELKALLINRSLFTVLCDPLFIGLLEHVIIGDASFEKLLTIIRQIILEVSLSDVSLLITMQAQQYLNAFAMQCFFNEYIYMLNESEQNQIEALRSKIDECGITPAIRRTQLAILGCYVPLYQLKKVTLLEKENLNEAFFNLVKTQIIEPRIEKQLSSQIPSLGIIQNEISKKVQNQYEANPYPRWTSFSKKPSLTLEAFLKGKFPYLINQIIPSNPTILIAGCGTGQQVFNTANQFQHAKIMAFDLSRSALAFALRKAQELDFSRIEFFQADILDLSQLTEKFDLIECIGVLHHMEAPFKGWQALKRLLQPGGWMNIGLYSEIGRQDVVAARNFIQKSGYHPGPDGIRQCRQQILNLPDDNIAKQVSFTLDFYTTSACRDLLFHVHEYRFNLLEIAAMLEKLNLEFIGFELRENRLKQKYQEQFPRDPKGTSLINWHQFEQENPETFSGMYQFWVKDKLS